MEELAEPAVVDVVDSIAVARLYGEPLFDLPQDLYIPPDALEVFLEAFEGPLDLFPCRSSGRSTPPTSPRSSTR